MEFNIMVMNYLMNYRKQGYIYKATYVRMYLKRIEGSVAEEMF